MVMKEDPSWGLPRGHLHAGKWVWNLEPTSFTGPTQALTLSQGQHLGAESDL